MVPDTDLSRHIPLEPNIERWLRDNTRERRRVSEGFVLIALRNSFAVRFAIVDNNGFVCRLGYVCIR